MGDNSSLILRNHRTLAISETIADAFVRIYFVERACKAQIHALTPVRDAVLEAPMDHADRVAWQNAEVAALVSRQLVWPMFLPRTDQIDDGYLS
jgi:ribulose-5-phosphate 4-epimerase/fuculose-1-phosphate aldolase